MTGTSIYHIVNGDVVGNKIQALDGEIIVWREMYDLGPIYPSFSQEKLLERANYFESLLKIPVELFLQNIHNQEAKIEGIPREAEVVLWFEHDRYDQTMLLYILNKLSDHRFKKLSMVSIDEYPGIEPFIGLGQLSKEQLVSLYDTKTYLTEEQILQGVSGWKAYASNDPRQLEQWIASEPAHLPYVHRAFRTHLTYFPSSINSVNQVEELALRLVRDGVHTFNDLFQKTSTARPDDGLSDFHLSALLGKLAKGTSPLLNIVGELPNFQTPSAEAMLTLTTTGDAVLDGKLDRVDCCGLNWWLGGVHLKVDEWRWNGNRIIRTNT